MWYQVMYVCVLSLSLFPPYRDLQKNIHIIYKVSETRLFINAYKSNISLYMQEWYEKKKKKKKKKIER